MNIYEKGIIDIYTEDDKLYIYGEDIYKLEGAKVYYTTWFNKRAKSLNLKENVDYKIIKDKIQHTVKRHLVTIDAAKKLYFNIAGPKIVDVINLLNNASVKPKEIITKEEPKQEAMIMEQVVLDLNHNELYPQIIEERGQLLKTGLINIYKDVTGKDVVDCRELYNFLKVQSKFSDWIKNKIKQYEFIESEDYVKVINKMPSGNTTIEYVITMDMAKELSMLESNEMGKQARKYFIEAEKALIKQTGPLDINNMLKAFINYNNYTQEKIETCYNKIISLQNQIDNIKLMEQPIRNVDKYNLSSASIAVQLNFYSTNGIPHIQFINSIARILGYIDSSANQQTTDYAYKEAQIGRASSIYYTYEAFEGIKKYIGSHENMFDVKLDKKDKKPIGFSAKLSADGKTYHFDIANARETIEYLIEKMNY